MRTPQSNTVALRLFSHRLAERGIRRTLRRTSRVTAKHGQEEVTKLWNAAKQRFPKKEDLVQHEIGQLLREAAERKARTTLAFLNKGNTKTSNDASAQAGTSAQNVQNTESADQDGTTHQQSRDQDDDDPQLAGAPKRKTQPLVVSDDEDEVTSNSTPSAMRPTPAQDIMKEKIAKLRVELDVTERRKKSLVADGTEHEKARKLRREIDGYEKKLKLKEKQRVYAMKHRENKKQKVIELCSKNPDAAKSLTPRAGFGRPRLEEEQSELLKAVVDWLYTREAKRHVVAVPVKLSRPEAGHHKAHQDQYFCVASIRSLETVASVLGPHSVNFLSQDDKARVPTGLIAANKQAPLVVKCDDRDCCSPRRSALHMNLHDRFLSPRYPITQVDGHLTIPDPEEHDGKREMLQYMRYLLFIHHESCRAPARGPPCTSCTSAQSATSRIVTRRATDLLCASDNGLEWLNRNEVEGADDFTENHMDMLVPVVTLETVHESPWTELE
ncbi:hypothetical protein PR048_000076 [Dryococelus australis]|uniref:Uncharacterized protein n=1 Tax=Dryococelus australis TaxID=614101 RepID=A0ABQ9IDL5_9NEOP|nr:hypothetical protein PR048_000076 [Dryococelus australis]